MTSLSDDRKKKLNELREAAFKHLEQPLPTSKKGEKDTNIYPDGWRIVRERKWEFRSNNLVLATVFHKPNDKFSLWFKTPMIYYKLTDVIATTYMYDSLEASQKAFVEHISRITDWCEAVLHCVKSKNSE